MKEVRDAPRKRAATMPVQPGRDRATGDELEVPLDTPAATSHPKWVLEDHVALGILVLLGCVVFAQFLSRYVFNHSIGWTEEGARMLLVLLVFVGAAGAASRRGHVSVEILELIVPDRVKRWLRGFNHLLSAGFFGYVAWLSWQVSQRVWHSSMSTLPITKGWLYIVVAMACAAMAFRLARRGIAFWREKEER